MKWVKDIVQIKQQLLLYVQKMAHIKCLCHKVFFIPYLISSPQQPCGVGAITLILY